MKVRRVFISLVCLVMTTLAVSGQVAVKTNVAMDALAIPNAGIELGLSKKLTLDVPVYYNPFKQVMWREQEGKLFKLLWFNRNSAIGSATSSMAISLVCTVWAVLITQQVSTFHSVRLMIWPTSVTKVISTAVVSAMVISTF